MKNILMIIALCFLSYSGFGQPGSTDPGPGFGCSNGTNIYQTWVGYKDPYNSGGPNKQSYFSLTGKVYAINNNQNANCNEVNRDGPNKFQPVSGASNCIVTSDFGANTIVYAGGTLVSFAVVECPLDGYLHFFLVVSAGLGFFFLRKRGVLG